MICTAYKQQSGVAVDEQNGYQDMLRLELCFAGLGFVNQLAAGPSIFKGTLVLHNRPFWSDSDGMQGGLKAMSKRLDCL